MIIAALFVALRVFVQLVTDEYVAKTDACQNLLEKAIAEPLQDIKSAYFLKVMQADNAAVAETFASYKLDFLASNTTYATEAEIINAACKPSYAVTEFLSWTAGVTPLFIVWVSYVIAMKIVKCRKSKPIQRVEIELPEAEPELDAPPRTPLYVPLHREEPKREPKREPKLGIRRRKPRGEPREPKKEKGPTVMEKISSLSPALKNRIMNMEPMV